MTRRLETTSENPDDMFGRRNAAMRKQFGIRLRSIMQQKNLSQSDLTRELYGDDSKRPMVSKWLKGVTFPSTQSLGLLAEVLDIEPSELLPVEMRAAQHSANFLGISFYNVSDPDQQGVSINMLIKRSDMLKVASIFQEFALQEVAEELRTTKKARSTKRRRKAGK